MSITKYIRNIFIRAVSAGGGTYLYKMQVKKKQGALVRVVVFHDVRDKVWFQEVITFMRAQYAIISPDDFVQGRFDQTRINILITFDDGYDSWVTTCLPILAAHGIRALFFANTGLLDVHDDTEAQEHFVRDRLLLSGLRKALSWEGLQQLHATGHTIGGHSKTHARLAQLQKSEQEYEIMDDKQRIENVLQTAIAEFAYPFGNSGDFTMQTQALVQEAGYAHAFTTEPGFAATSNAFAISRLCLEDGLSTRDLGNWIEGGYDLYSKLKYVCVR